jgi:hypothetical protein
MSEVCKTDLERCVVGVLEYLLVASNMVSMRAAGPLLDALGAPPKSGMGDPYQGLTLLKHRTLEASIWDLQAGNYPLITKAMAVKWILGLCNTPSIICHECIDINHPTLPLEDGEVVLLLAQAAPNENGAYVYIGEGLSLMR